MSIKPAAINTDEGGGLLGSQRRVFLGGVHCGVFYPVFTQCLANDLFNFSTQRVAQDFLGLAHFLKIVWTSTGLLFVPYASSRSVDRFFGIKAFTSSARPRAHWGRSNFFFLSFSSCAVRTSGTRKRECRPVQSPR